MFCLTIVQNNNRGGLKVLHTPVIVSITFVHVHVHVCAIPCSVPEAPNIVLAESTCTLNDPCAKNIVTR